jgi:hypothetical protein
MTSAAPTNEADEERRWTRAEWARACAIEEFGLRAWKLGAPRTSERSPTAHREALRKAWMGRV